MIQFGNFLAGQLASDEYVKRFPSVDVMTSLYHTPPDVAFFLSRPIYLQQINVSSSSILPDLPMNYYIHRNLYFRAKLI